MRETRRPHSGWRFDEEGKGHEDEAYAFSTGRPHEREWNRPGRDHDRDRAHHGGSHGGIGPVRRQHGP